jgi:hypothetical protein
MGQSIADRRRKFFSNVDESIYAKARKKADADRRQREAKDVRNNARRLAFALNMAS